jgi:hypothetical protein
MTHLQQYITGTTGRSRCSCGGSTGSIENIGGSGRRIHHDFSFLFLEPVSSYEQE